MFKNKPVFSTLIFAKPSFLAGFGQAIDLGGTFNAYNSNSSEKEADVRAIANDWRVVGAELEEAMTSR